MVDGERDIAHGLDGYGDIKMTVFLRGMCFVVHGLRAQQDTSLPRSIGESVWWSGLPDPYMYIQS